MPDHHLTDNDTQNALEAAKGKTREHGRYLWKIISRYTDVGSLSKTPQKSKTEPAKERQYSSTLISILSSVPYLLLGLFIFSFFWDFNAFEAELFGKSLIFEGLLRIISVSGLIGFLTNWLAITMLFKPAQKRPILGHGLIPAQKNRIAFRLAQAVSQDLINPEIIKKKINESNIIGRYR